MVGFVQASSHTSFVLEVRAETTEEMEISSTKVASMPKSDTQSLRSLYAPPYICWRMKYKSTVDKNTHLKLPESTRQFDRRS